MNNPDNVKVKQVIDIENGPKPMVVRYKYFTKPMCIYHILIFLATRLDRLSDKIRKIINKYTQEAVIDLSTK